MGICMSFDEPKSKSGGSRKGAGGSRKGAQSPSARPKRSTSGNNSSASVVAAPKDVEDLRRTGGYGNVLVFTYIELRAATKNFRPDQILGEGGFGVVYKGIIDESIRPDFTTTPIAVKVLNPDSFQGDREWLTEVNYLGQLSHPNLVKLIGFCCEGAHRLLIYEFMACGSLEKHLFRRVCLTMPWSTRMKIALGAAKGLAFLHGAERPIIYRDFKTSNILLDAEYNAKLSDFGLAKEGPIGDQTHVSTRVVGTYGYAAPEYVMTGHLTARSDVYGFGVVLLEMLIGRKAMDKSRPSREHNLVEWCRPILIHNRKLLKIVDSRMEGQYSIRSLQKVASLTYQCLSQNPKGRPTMSLVVEILESLQDLLDSNADMLLQNGGSAVTLYEVPKDELESSAERRKGEGGSIGKSRAHSRRRIQVPNGRSKSEPALEFLGQVPSPESDGPQPDSKSPDQGQVPSPESDGPQPDSKSSDQGRRATLSIDEKDVYNI